MLSNSRMPRQYCTSNTPSAHGAARLSCPRKSLKTSSRCRARDEVEEQDEVEQQQPGVYLPFGNGSSSDGGASVEPAPTEYCIGSSPAQSEHSAPAQQAMHSRPISVGSSPAQSAPVSGSSVSSPESIQSSSAGNSTQHGSAS